MIFFKKKSRRNSIPEVNGLELYNLIGSMADVDNKNLDFYMPVVDQIKERIEDAYNIVCCRGQIKRAESPIFSDMQMGFFCNIFSWLSVCNYKAAWSAFYEFARCDRWPHKGYFLSAQEIISVKYILNAFEKAGEMSQMYLYDILYNDCINMSFAER